MKEYKISGEEKTKVTSCNICDNGKKLQEEFVKYGKYDGDTEERICGVCNTKFKFPKKLAEKLFEEHCMGCPELGFEKCENKEKEYLCFGTTEKFINTLNVEGNKMVLDLDLVSNKQLFKETGFCPEHSWTKSNGVKTSEGVFHFESCVICKTGKVEYKGKVLEDGIMNLVNFIAHNGIENEKKVKAKQAEFTKLEEMPVIDEEINLDELFEVTPAPVKDFGFV